MDRENNVGYIVGQVMGIADYLHSARCYIRNENLPASLIGSRFVRLFANRYKPSQSLINFDREFHFLKEWAKHIAIKGSIKGVSEETTKDIIIKYRWLESLMSKIDLPERFSIDDCAMVTLGYYNIRSFSPHKAEEKAVTA